MNLEELENYTQQLLECFRYKDYCPNGLQIEGKKQINTIVTGVTANQALIDAAISANADAILVHHGFFWKNESPTIRGIKRKRILALLENEISLLAYHLPLDAHPTLGNNAQLAKLLQIEQLYQCGDQNLLNVGRIPITSLANLANHIESVLQRSIQTIGRKEMSIQTLAWCTGGAQSYFQSAIDEKVQAFITGEISEPMVHLAREHNVAYLACGHHATERYGIQALGQHLSSQFGIKHLHIDIDSPV